MELDKYHPIGTPGELAELGIRGSDYFSCSPPTQENRGCRHYHICTQAFKGKERIGKEGEKLAPIGVEEQRINMEGKVIGMAPEELGIYRESRQSGRVKTQVMSCFHFYNHKIEWDQNKDTYMILGGPGTKIPVNETRESERKTKVGYSGQRIPEVSRVKVDREVPKFLRPVQVDEERVRAGDIRRYVEEAGQQRMREEILTGQKQPEYATLETEATEVPTDGEKGNKRRGG
jgi:hypothetical protein